MRNANQPRSSDRRATEPEVPAPSLGQRRDWALTADVLDVLGSHRLLHDGQFSVLVRGGVAHVAGTVRSGDERHLVRRVLARVRGIHAVWDVLRTPDQDPLQVIDLGCGRTKQHPWAIGVDCHPYDGVDVVADLEQKLPFADRAIDQVFAIHFLEHVRNLLDLMNEIHRVLKPDGVLHVMVPNHSFVNALADPTHVRFFHLQTFKFFCRPYPGLRPFHPLLASASVDNIYADLQPVQPGDRLPSEEHLARFFD